MAVNDIICICCFVVSSIYIFGLYLILVFRYWFSDFIAKRKNMKDDVNCLTATYYNHFIIRFYGIHSNNFKKRLYKYCYKLAYLQIFGKGGYYGK